jgi:hypothetical protein
VRGGSGGTGSTADEEQKDGKKQQREEEGAVCGDGVLKSHYLQELQRWNAKVGDSTNAAARPLMK